MDVPTLTPTETAGIAVPSAAAAPRGDAPPTAPVEHALSPDETLRSPLAKLVGADDLTVSFREEGGQIVTVFRDARTNDEISQFPAEVLVKIAEFFNKLAGAVIDRSA